MMDCVFHSSFTPHWLVNCKVNTGLHFDWYYGRMSIKVINIQFNSHNTHHFLSSCHMIYTALGHLELLSHFSFDPGVGKTPWSKRWQPTPVFLPGESHGQRSLASYCPWGRESQTWQQLNHHHSFIYFFQIWAMWMHNLIPRKKCLVTFFKKPFLRLF